MRIKKAICLILVICCVGFLATGCGKGKPSEGIDYDLTTMTGARKQQIIDLLSGAGTRDYYVGRTIKMEGRYYYHHAHYIVADGCCTLGIAYDGDYPPNNSDIVIVGIWTKQGHQFFIFITSLTVI